MKTKLWSLLFTVCAAASAFAAGDIYEIVPCTEYGIKRAAYASYDNPIRTVGSDKYYFTVRMMVRDAGNLNPNSTAGYMARYFYLKHTNPLASEEYDANIEENRFGIGVFVSGKETASSDVLDSGKLEYAKLVTIVPNAASYTNFFDCVFEYTLKPGHFALPVRLAVEDTDLTGATKIRPANDSEATSEYHFCNTDKWEIRYVAEDVTPTVEKAAVWTINTTASSIPRQKPSGSTSYNPTRDYSLAKAGLYVQTIDFDQWDSTLTNKVWEGEKYWHEVPMGDELQFSVKAFAEASGVSEDTTLFVWSMDESAVKIVGGQEITMATNILTGPVTNTMKVTVGTITMAGGTASADFRVLGVTSNKIANVVLSSWKGFRFNNGIGEPIQDYKMIPIKCGDKPAPSVELSFDKDYPKAASSKTYTAAASTNFNNRAADAIPFYVTLTQPAETEVKVGVSIKWESDTSVDPIAENYIYMSDNGDEFFETSKYCTNVTFKAGETQQTLYIYPLGADKTKREISFTPELLTAGTTYEVGKACKLTLEKDKKPEILLPASGTDYGDISSSENLPIDLFVNDCFRDMKNTNGMSMVFTLDLKGLGTTNIVFNIGDSTEVVLKLKELSLTEGQKNGTIAVKDPQGQKSDPIAISFNYIVEKQKRVVFSQWYDTDGVTNSAPFNEGTAIVPQFAAQNGTPQKNLYIFLVPQDELSSNVVESLIFTKGMPLYSDSTETESNQSDFKLSLLDGGPTAGSETRVSYKIVVSTDQNDPTKVDEEYESDSKPVAFSIKNVYSSITAVYVNGSFDAVENNENAVWKHEVPAAVGVPFKAKISDPSEKFDVKEGLSAIWCFTEGRDSSVSKYEYQTITNQSNILSVEHEFTYAGGATQSVRVVAFDKDMLAVITNQSAFADLCNPESENFDKGTLYLKLTEFADPYKFKVVVGKRPSVKVYFPDFDDSDTCTVLENAKSGVMCFELSEAASEDVYVRVTVTNLNEKVSDRAKLGNFEFVKGTIKIQSGEKAPKRSAIYNNGLKFKYDTLDGTAISFDDGFYVTVEIVDAGGDVNEYYEAGEAWVYVQNTPPTIYPLEPETPETNRNVTVNSPFDIVWHAKDVDADLAEPGLIAKWYDNGVEFAPSERVTSTDDRTTTLTLTQEGFHKITLEVTDKDGSDYYGQSKRNWYYYIEPTKRLKISPYGPASVSSTYYDGAKGIGQGRVYADGTLASIQGFVHTWSYSISTAQAQMYAAGYASKTDADGNPETYYDDGTLGYGEPKRDAAITPYGEKWSDGGEYFPYDGKYDNFFYRWVYVGGTSNSYSKVNFQTVSGAEALAPLCKLDTYVAGKTSYDTVEAEAIFSRENYTSDNLGDINGDGIPDLYMRVYYNFGAFDAKGILQGDDLASSFVKHDDGDYLPTRTSFSAKDTFGATNTWELESVPFAPLEEIRGYNDEKGNMSHFNDAYQIIGTGIAGGTSVALLGNVKADLNFIEPQYNNSGVVTNGSTLSMVEWLAFKEYCERKGWEVTDPAHWGIQDGSYDNSWSPERPTDPTLEDTDDDKMPDGFEYYIWYKAHVGTLVGGEVEHLVGRRYRIDHPLDPEIIDFETIASIYDPLVKNSSFMTADTDNDGLTDFVEFSLGTSPIDCDSDGDGIPDGYEVYRTLTDPCGCSTDDEKNPDHDAMVYAILEDWKVLPLYDENTNLVGYVCGDGDFTLDEEGKITGIPERCYDAWKCGTHLAKPFFARGFAYKGRNYFDFDEGLLVDDSEDILGKTAGEPLEEIFIAAIHYDAYTEWGFDPRVGWKYDAEPYSMINNGETYNPALHYNPPLCTKAFTHLDESMVSAFYIHMKGWEGYCGRDRVAETADDGIVYDWELTTTDPHNADTDGDGAPDGWELYVQHRPTPNTSEKDPKTGLQADYSHMIFYATSPFEGTGVDVDEIQGRIDMGGSADGLSQNGEFSGIESSAEYPDCATISLISPEWRNKLWPTDPWDCDTDGDGVSDGEEGEAFIYGSSGTAGGGLNPHSWDTDADGLPDGWELQFAGTSTTAAGTSTTTTAEDGSEETTVVAGETTWNDDGMDGTVSDAMKDYDHDGLYNWQEYMAGAMRCWRYDDNISSWFWNLEDAKNYTGDQWYTVLTDPESEDFNPCLADQVLDPAVYFSGANKAFEQSSVYGRMYMFSDGYYHDLKRDAGDVSVEYMNRWARQAGDMLIMGAMTKNYPSKYISCDPTKYDTDEDGMDDFYELFHGLNPLMGTLDIVGEAWGDAIAYNFNKWYGCMTPTDPRPDKGPRAKNTGIDFFQYPWMAGMHDADPDGDNIRNQQEGIFSIVQAESTYLHVDPTPLWMTDSSYEDSLTRRYYQIWTAPFARSLLGAWPSEDGTFTTSDGKVHYWRRYPWLLWDQTAKTCSLVHTANNWEVLDTMFSFEENEGYDSDHDFLSDFEEAQGKTKAASDPQDPDSPLRRQAMWFGGDDDPGFLQTPLSMDEYVPEAAMVEIRQNFLYYTVECWAKADESTYQSEELQTLVERAIWTGVSNPADETFLRKNFVLGLKGGRWYTRFDSTGTDLYQPVEINDGPVATTDWTHLAATYDGEELKLYVNGILAISKGTSIQPEHGVNAIFVDDLGQYIGTKTDLSLLDRTIAVPLISTLVGASATSRKGIIFDYQWQIRDAYNFGLPNGIATPDYNTTIDDYGNFFKGYIDEVRIWDGARTDAAIKSDYIARTRYNAELAAENRNKVYLSWSQGNTRVLYTDTTELPAQLMYHWSFDHVTGAVNAEDVMPQPGGFSAGEGITDAKAIWSRPEEWTSVWFDSIDDSIRSRVYTDTAWVPWVVNTVAHLPRYDGTVLDSTYWSENFAGDKLSISNGYEKFTFPRNAEVPCRWSQVLYVGENGIPVANDSRWEMINKSGDATTLKQEYMFERRNKLAFGSDLMIFGGAFPKRISDDEGGMWDGQGAADAWAETCVDSNADGLPDWWAQYALENYYDGDPTGTVDWDTTVNYYGHEIFAGEAYKRDLARGMLPDGNYYDEYKDRCDSDSDGIPDWWEDLYGVDTQSSSDAYEDCDNDGLNNYTEYILSEVFDMKDEGGNSLFFDPDDAFSIDADVPDYFFQVGDLYVGEIFDDHDRMPGDWEHQYLDDVSPYLYDCESDPDMDGWSNFAEFQAGTDPTLISQTGIDNSLIDDYPVPTVELSVGYDGTQNTVGSPLVVKAWHDLTLQSKPDAIWTIGGDSTNLVSGTKYVGMNSNSELVLHLSPGSISKGSVKFKYLDPSSRGDYSNTYESVDALWTEVLVDREISGNNTTGDIVDQTSLDVVGSINYITGKVVVDLSKVSPTKLVELSVDSSNDGYWWWSNYTYDLTKSYIKVQWNAQPIIGLSRATYYLADADEPSSESNSAGHLLEGKNTFVAFYDLDGNGAYTAGEPYGFVYGVDVGWNYAKATIELTDTSVVTARFDAENADNDRAVLYGTESGNLPDERIVVGTGAGGKYERVRVVRTLIDESDVEDIGVPVRVVLDKEVYIDDEHSQCYITEADFINDENPDIDWEHLADDIAAGQTEGMIISNVSYRIVLGNGDVKNTTTNNLLGLVFTRQYDLKEIYTLSSQKPVIIGNGIFNSASPTFSWYIPNGLNSYTAFEINVYDANNSLAWNSGFQRIPARVRDDTYGWRYDWTAPIYAGDKLTNGVVFVNYANYRWEVRVTNSRFRNIANWSEMGEFRMNVLTNSIDYGTINVAVRYYGPASMSTSKDGIIRVQAFDTPDFSGDPVGQGYVRTIADVDSTDPIKVGNASIIGLKSGNYYIRAFIDSNNDGVCQDWETWGFHCVRDYSSGVIYNVSSVQVGPSIGINTVVPVYLDDSDTDHDNLPDAWEYDKFGSLDKHGVKLLDENLANGISVKSELAGEIETTGTISGGLSVLTMQSLANPYMASLICGVPVTGDETSEEVVDALAAAAGELSEENSTVEIVAISLDYENKAVVVDVSGKLESSANSAMAIYNFEGVAGKTYTMNLLHKATLDGEWAKVDLSTPITFTLGINEDTITIPVDDGIDFNSGFFMLELAE